MAYKLSFHPSAQKEYLESTEWYLKRSLKAASNFAKAIDKGLLTLRKDPKRNRNVYKHYFQYVLLRYPFTIIYAIEEEQQEIIIIAIYHQKRIPEDKYR